jgi:hypothetical protein
LIATSTHDVQEQHGPLSGVHHVFIGMLRPQGRANSYKTLGALPGIDLSQPLAIRPKPGDWAEALLTWRQIGPELLLTRGEPK